MLIRSLIILVCLAHPLNAEFTAPEPEDLMIYHVFLDRFENGDPSNDGANPRSSHQPTAAFGWHGGDLKGVQNQLDYIQGLGVNGIWLSPFVENVNSYHGYAAYNWYNVDPGFGTLEDLQNLIDDANSRGIAVYFDMVAGHMGNLIDSGDFGFAGYRPPPSTYNLRWRFGLQYPEPFNNLDLFHGHGGIGNYFGQEQEVGELAGLDDLKTETPEVQSLMTDVWEYWMENTNVSGFRIDTVKHVDRGFWEEFLPRLQQKASDLGRENYYTFGEIFGADDNFMAEYLGTLRGGPYKLDGAVDFQYYYSSQGVFARADRPPSDLSRRLEFREQVLGPHHLKMPNFFDNHDVRRFLSVASDNPGAGLSERLKRLELALVYIFFSPGPPIIYYGTEQAFDGGNDPYNREDMFDGEFEFGPSNGDNFDTTSPFYQLIARLARIRREIEPLRRGNYQEIYTNFDGPGLLVTLRETDEDFALSILNTSTTPQQLPSLTIETLASTVIADALDPSSVASINSTGMLPGRTIDPLSAELWIRSEAVPPLPVSILAFNPGEGETRVALNVQSLSVTFSEEMDQGLTNRAISLTPGLSYVEQWSGNGDRVELLLQEELEPRTEYTISVSKEATSLGAEPVNIARSSSFMTDRDLTSLPPIDVPVANLPITARDFSIDGEAGDWPEGGSQVGFYVVENVYHYVDDTNEAPGDGDYQYPSNPVFSGTDADLSLFCMAWDESNLYFLIQPREVVPFASFYTPYFGISIDTGRAGGLSTAGYDQESGEHGITELELHPAVYSEFEVVYTGPRGHSIYFSDGSTSTAGESSYNPLTGTVEISIPMEGLESSSNEWTLLVYSGLETFGGLREAGVQNGEYELGGGITELSDPDIIDMLGATPEDQLADLSNYDELFPTVVLHSYLRINLIGSPMDHWILY